MIAIGVTPAFIYPDPNRPYFSKKTLACLENEMSRFLCQQGALPILIPDVLDWESYCKKMDAFVLQGGSDIAPETYGETNPKWPGDRYRDELELKILDYAVKNDKPVLGICRGCQLINVYFGGTLYQDLDTQVTHRDQELYDDVLHRVELTEGGVLANLYKTKKISVNSIHHQGIKELGKNLTAEATSIEDGLIEAIASSNKRILGVQWHPEFYHKKVADPQALLAYLLQEKSR